MLISGRTDAERKKFGDDLPGLQRTQALARRQIREAKEHRRRQVSSPKKTHSPDLQCSCCLVRW